MNRILPAYRALWDRHPVAALVTLLGVAFGSAAAAAFAAWRFPDWAALPAAFTVAAMLLIWAAPGDSPDGRRSS